LMEKKFVQKLSVIEKENISFINVSRLDIKLFL